MKIGCVALVYVWSEIIGIKCTKGRGIILPGGKWEEGESFHETAMRELKEETGLEAKRAKFIWGGLSGDGTYTYTFQCDVMTYEPKSSPEGEVIRATWEELFQSQFGSYYKILRDVCERLQSPGQ